MFLLIPNENNTFRSHVAEPDTDKPTTACEKKCMMFCYGNWGLFLYCFATVLYCSKVGLIKIKGI